MQASKLSFTVPFDEMIVAELGCEVLGAPAPGMPGISEQISVEVDGDAKLIRVYGIAKPTEVEA
jgi:hypothetical protein